MKNRKILSLLLAGTMTAALLAAPAQAAETPPIRVSNYKGNTLEVGERSGLIIGPSGMDYTITSSAPDTVAVEQITGFGVAVAKGAGTAEIVAANRAGASGTLTLTVGSAYAPASPDSANQPENLDIRQELIRLINQTRKANGVSELPVSEALMNAAKSAPTGAILGITHRRSVRLPPMLATPTASPTNVLPIRSRTFVAHKSK